MAPTPSPSEARHPPSPTTSTPHPSATRIRENQRRSRARRKAYLQELESKLRKCEQAGIEASVDLQLAARAVAEENKRLREENAALREEGETLKGENGRMRGYLGLEKVAQGDGGALVKQQKHVGISVNGEYAARASFHGAEDAGSVARCKLPGSTDRQGEESTTTAHVEEVYPHPTQAPPDQEPRPEVLGIGGEHEMVLGDDTSSCEYAAHIITSMRADVSTDEVRADLGCGGDVREWRRCKVDNSKLFVAVDRYAG